MCTQGPFCRIPPRLPGRGNGAIKTGSIWLSQRTLKLPRCWSWNVIFLPAPSVSLLNCVPVIQWISMALCESNDCLLCVWYIICLSVQAKNITIVLRRKHLQKVEGVQWVIQLVEAHCFIVNEVKRLWWPTSDLGWVLRSGFRKKKKEKKLENKRNGKQECQRHGREKEISMSLKVKYLQY